MTKLTRLDLGDNRLGGSLEPLGALVALEVARGVLHRRADSLLARPGCSSGFDARDCRCDWWRRQANEDLNTAVCFKQWGVLPEETRDEWRRQRFFLVSERRRQERRCAGNAAGRTS